MSHRLNSRYARRATSIVELALVLPVLLALLMSILEFGYLTRNNLMLSNAAREGARSLALGQTTTVAKARLRSTASALSIPDSAISLVYSTDNGATYPNAVSDSATNNAVPAGSLIKVAINFPHKPLTGFFPVLNNYAIRVNAAMRREG